MSTLTPSDPLPDDPAALQALVQSQRARIAELEQQLAWFLVQYRLAQHRRFAASTETGVHQLELFAELLAEDLPGDTIPVPAPALASADPQARPSAALQGATGDGDRCRRHCRGKRSGMAWPRRRKPVPAVASHAS